MRKIPNLHGKRVPFEVESFGEGLAARIAIVLDGRPAHWLTTALNWNTGTVHAVMAKGANVKIDKLLSLVRVERACLDWLVTGGGTPFSVGLRHDDAELSLSIDQRMAEESWAITLVGDDQPRAVVLEQPAEIIVAKIYVPYTETVVFAGPVGPLTTATLLRHHARMLMTDRARDLAAGLVGNYRWQLLKTSLPSRPLSDCPVHLQAPAEEVPQALKDAWGAMSPRAQGQYLAIAQTLAEYKN